MRGEQVVACVAATSVRSLGVRIRPDVRVHGRDPAAPVQDSECVHGSTSLAGTLRLPAPVLTERIADVAVRRAEPADAARIAEIHVRSWQTSYQGLISQDYLDGLDPAGGRDRWAESLEQADWSRGGSTRRR